MDGFSDVLAVFSYNLEVEDVGMGLVVGNL